MRIAIGQAGHETNTFSPVATDVAAFRAFEWQSGEDILQTHRGVKDFLGGMIEAARDLRVEVTPTFSAFAYPSGKITRETREALVDGLVRGLAAAEAVEPVDAVCLALHGAGVAEGAEDLEAEILRAVRSVVGFGIPLVCTLDLHANLSQEMLEQADALLGVHLYPHTDSRETGREAVELAHRISTGQAPPVAYLERLPLLVPPSTTNHPPASEINEACWEWERTPGIIDCVFFHGFPYADVPLAGASVLVLAEQSEELARRAAEDVGRRIWEARARFFEPVPGPAEGVRAALRATGRPVIVNETSDNPGAGTPGDGTRLLRAMLESGIEESCFGYINDPEVARIAHQEGVGSQIEVALGGKSDAFHGEPLRVSARVKCLTDGRFVHSTPMWEGLQVDLGASARLQLAGIDVVVCSKNAQVLDEQGFLLHGIDVSRYRVVGLKSSHHFRAVYEGLGDTIVTVDSPGLSTRNLSSFDYTNLVRTIYPLDGGGAAYYESER